MAFWYTGKISEERIVPFLVTYRRSGPVPRINHGIIGKNKKPFLYPLDQRIMVSAGKVRSAHPLVEQGVSREKRAAAFKADAARSVSRGMYDLDTALSIIPVVFYDAPKEIYGL